MQWVSGRLEVERMAEALARGFGGPPADLEAIARVVGIIDIAYCDIEGAALLQECEGEWGVLIREWDARTRQRFSLAHEIAHIALGIVGDEARYGGFKGRSAAERLCDYYAAGLLMPRALVCRAAEETPNVMALAREFDVSMESMRIRLEHVGLHSMAGTLVRGRLEA